MAAGLRELAVFARASFRPERPDRLLRAAVAAAVGGPTVVGAFAAGAARYPEATAVVDHLGSISYRQLWQASDGAARQLRADGVGPGIPVGLLCRNHRGFVVAMLAVARLGADLVLLNTGFAGPQLADVANAESLRHIVHDADLADVLLGCELDRSWAAEDLGRSRSSPHGRPLATVRREGRWVILTSGTTGRPKGAARRAATAAGSAAALLAAIPIRSRDTVVIAPPLFHAWGLAHLGLALTLSSTVVLAPTFDAGAVIGAIADHRADGLIVVPTMLHRMLLAANESDRPDPRTIPSLRYVASSGSDLGAGLATRALAHFGPIVHNVYGSTEVAVATIASPADLKEAPGTAGRAVPGVTVRILDGNDDPVAGSEIGRVFVGSSATFPAYTDGTTRPTVGDLQASGDLGRIDRNGRLFVIGREDDIVVTGGENVHPTEIEDCLLRHAGVDDAAVVGVADEDLGMRLEAFVVGRPGHTLSAAALRDHVRSRLARAKVPATVTFVDRIPRTATGKIRRCDVLPDPGSSPPPSG